MPDVKLGPEGRELTLPRPRYRSAPGWPVTTERNVEEAVMSDGSVRYNFRSEERQVWPLEWDLLTRSQVDDFEWLRRFKTALRFQNSWDNETWYTVVMTAFEREPLIDVHTNEVLYRVRLTLKEVR